MFDMMDLLVILPDFSSAFGFWLRLYRFADTCVLKLVSLVSCQSERLGCTASVPSPYHQTSLSTSLMSYQIRWLCRRPSYHRYPMLLFRLPKTPKGHKINPHLYITALTPRKVYTFSVMDPPDTYRKCTWNLKLSHPMSRVANWNGSINRADFV